MSARSVSETALPLAWPLAGSFVLTTAVVAFVCMPPTSPMHSWMQLCSRATLYLLVAGCVHALAIWCVCRVREESEDAGMPMIWALIWAAWIAIVWLPLVALLTTEHSPWVALVLPVTAVFATLLLKWRARLSETDPGDVAVEHVAAEPFQLLEAPQLWRILLPAACVAVAMQIAVVMMAAGHAWTAGCMFGAAAIYPVERWLDGSGALGRKTQGRRWGRTAAGNSLLVWALIVLALVPFMAAYAASKLSMLLGIPKRSVHLSVAASMPRSRSVDYLGVILVQPKKPKEIATPTPMAAEGAVTKTHIIPFDGAYWYFKQPNHQPPQGARVVRGDPVKQHFHSTDEDPLMMEAHQPLGQELALSCCRALRLDVSNGDNVPGSSSSELLLRNTMSLKTTAEVSLSTIVLPTSTVSPMPLTRPAVDDHVTFQLPQSARGGKFDEITVRIKPDRSRALAGAHVAIKDFVLQP